MIDQIIFSIIIPCHNRGSFIADTVNSVLNQPFQLFQVIVVDDGSTDNTESVIRSFSDSRIEYFKIVNSERGAARNFGLLQARGMYVNYFDSDDLLVPCFEELFAFIQANKFPEVVYGDIQHIDSKGNKLKVKSPPQKSFTKNLLHNNFLACGSVFLRHDVALQFLFHEDRRLSSAEDWELWLRVHAKYPFRHFSGFIFQQVHHDDRSLMKINAKKIEDRDSYFASLVRKNYTLVEHYGIAAVNLFVADRFTFIALAWCEHGRSKAFHYWGRAFKSSLLVMKRKRFWAVLKKLILG